nr:LRR receptor-like kinase plant-like protein [Ipomoea batatas]
MPAGVMNTAVVPSDPTQPLTFSWSTKNSSDELYIYMSFSEIQQLPSSNQTREFNIYLNGDYYFGPGIPPYLKAATVNDKTPHTNRTRYQLSFEKTPKSTLPPMINALEVYRLKHFNEPQTYDTDVAAMISIKSVYGVRRNWEGDPCSPASYAWTGLQCNNQGFSNPRIISLSSINSVKPTYLATSYN